MYQTYLSPTIGAIVFPQCLYQKCGLTGWCRAVGTGIFCFDHKQHDLLQSQTMTFYGAPVPGFSKASDEKPKLGQSWARRGDQGLCYGRQVPCPAPFVTPHLLRLPLRRSLVSPSAPYHHHPQQRHHPHTGGAMRGCGGGGGGGPLHRY